MAAARPATAQAPSASFNLLTEWNIPQPAHRVWEALIRTDDWPQWWPYVRAVETIAEGTADGLNRVQRLRWATRLPYELTIEVEAVEIIPLHKLRGLARGELNGQGTWTLEPHPGGTRVHYLWQVNLEKAWMRLSAPLLTPVFRWNHEGVMAAGEKGLIGHLGQGK